MRGYMYYLSYLMSFDSLYLIISQTAATKCHWQAHYHVEIQ